MRARLAALADPKNGYKDPQLNVPHPRAVPGRHNGTWAPYTKHGEELPPLTVEEVATIAASVSRRPVDWD